jgi:hypothetical protein
VIRVFLVLLTISATDGHEIEKRYLKPFTSMQACLEWREREMVPEKVKDGMAKHYYCEATQSII